MNLKKGKPLSETLEYYTENKSIHDLTQIESMLEIALGNLDINRVHQKLLKEIGTVVSTLDNFGDTEPFDNYNKYVGKPGDEFPNEILWRNLEKLNERLKALHDKQAQPGPSTNANAAKKNVPKPEAKISIPKPEAKKSKGKEKSKDVDDTIILNRLTKLSDSELEKYNNNEELKKTIYNFIIWSRYHKHRHGYINRKTKHWN